MWTLRGDLRATFCARRIGISGWGGMVNLVSVLRVLHTRSIPATEWAYQTRHCLPLYLLAADRYARTGRAGGWRLALLWGVQITLGHFQVQMWTGGLSTRAPGLAGCRRAGIVGLGLGIVWAGGHRGGFYRAGVGAADLVGQTDIQAIGIYSPSHWRARHVPGLFPWSAAPLLVYTMTPGGFVMSVCRNRSPAAGLDRRGREAGGSTPGVLTCHQ